MVSDRIRDNEKAIAAAADTAKKEQFLAQEKAHILRLAAVILKRRITDSDDEWSISLIAVSDAIDNYNESRGDFWGYAAVVVRNRLYDYLRKEKRIGEHEMTVSPEAFSGDGGADDETDAARLSVSKMSSEHRVESDLKEELRALKEELLEYDITFRDLAESSPKSQKTKKECALALAAMFLPPPLYDLLVKKKKLPMKEIELRTQVKRKLLDRHRKHLVAATLVCAEDYPILREYFPYEIG
ncbi:MAG: hypothetical protein K6B14_09375 [Lachnospiraceae bacterium]|nr:hypothetical protein [Lachnospiraceae bacterium]